MEMKALEVLIPLWMSNTPPSPAAENENDYLLEITASDKKDWSVTFFLVISWCIVKKNYYCVPVDVLDSGKLVKTEACFDTQGLLQFYVKMSQLGIKDVRQCVDVTKQKDYRQQLVDIYPTFNESKR